MEYRSPADLIRSVRERRGDDPGPPEDVVLRNDLVFDPEDDEERILRESGGLAPVQTVPAVRPPLELGVGVRQDRRGGGERERAVSQPAQSEEGVSYTAGEGFFLGHYLKLNEAEKKALKDLLARVVLRQLREEKQRIKEA